MFSRVQVKDECRQFRQHLVAGKPGNRHLADCPRCGIIAQRWQQIEQVLSEDSKVGPAPGFAGRVCRRLDGRPHPVVAIALRVVPATLATVVALTLWLAYQGALTNDGSTAAVDDYVAWVMEAVDDE